VVSFQDTQSEKKFEFGILNLEKSCSCGARALPCPPRIHMRRCDSRAENIFSQIVMNSFSTVFKRRAITMSIAILYALAIVFAIGLRRLQGAQTQCRRALREARARRCATTTH
jgi:hypothetical protein